MERPSLKQPVKSGPHGVPTYLDEERDPYISLIRQHLFNWNSELPKMVTMVRAVEEVRVVNDASIHHSFVQAFLECNNPTYQ